MAQKVEVRLIDDLTGEEAVETVEFSIDGATFEIDLSTGNAGKLRDHLADYVAAARKVTRARPGARPAGRPASKKVTNVAGRREQLGAIREWARKNGHRVADRGRIPLPVIAAWEADHGPVAQTA